MEMLICKTPTCDYVNMLVSQVNLSVIKLEPQVDQLVKLRGMLAHSIMITQLCHHSREVKNFGGADDYWPHVL